MIEGVVQFAGAFWALIAEMAPYLWIGFTISFFLKLFVQPSVIRRHLGGEGFSTVWIATLAGLPLPLCSCGVLPVAAAIRREGGGKAGVAAFTISTPQTGVDSVLATAGLLGWGMALFRLLTALVSGVLAGFLVSLFTRQKPSKAGLDAASAAPPSCCCKGSPAPEAPTDVSCCSSEPDRDAATVAEVQSCPPPPPLRATSEAAEFAFLRLPADIGLSLIVGTILAALAIFFAPEWSAESLPGGVFGAYLLVSLFAIPVYVCSTGVIPLAFGLIAAGFPPGAAFILLTAGPSVSATSLITLGRLIGTRATVLAAGTLLLVTWCGGLLVDFSPLQTIVPECSLHEASIPVWRHISAAALIALLLAAKISRSERPSALSSK